MILKGTYFLGDVTVDYYIDATPGAPMRGPSMDHPGDPEEHPEVNSMELMIGTEDFDPTDIYIRRKFINRGGKTDYKYDALEDLIFEAALCEPRD
jgi:hypothetical protein